MKIPTEPAGSIARPLNLIEAINPDKAGVPEVKGLYRAAIPDTLSHFEKTGSPVATDGARRKHHNFQTNCVHGLPTTSSAVFLIPFAADRVRSRPRLAGVPFRHMRWPGKCWSL